MNINLRVAGSIAISALILGVAGCALFRDSSGSLLSSCGPNLLVWMVFGLLALVILARLCKINVDAEGRWLAVPLCFFAGSFMLIGSPFLQFWSGVLMAISALLLLTRCRGAWKLTLAGYTEYLRLLILGAYNVVAGPLLLAGSDMRHASIAGDSPGENKNNILRVLGMLVRGSLLAILPLIVFGCLFVNADPVFRRFMQNLFDWDFSTFASYAFWTLFFGFIACGALRTALLLDPIPDQSATDTSSASRRFFRTPDIIIALAMINILFALFVAFQFQFLFGGESIVDSIPGLTFASYARSGFFELAWVASLALPVLLLAHWLTRSEVGQGQARVKLMTLVLVALLLVVVASAFKRMWLYEYEWGLTEKRLLVSVFIGAISLVFLWFLRTVWRGEPRRFAFGLLLASMVTVGGLDIVNPDAIVIRTNVARTQGLRYFDAQYLDSLGPDAVPQIVAGIGAMTANQQAVMAGYLMEEWTDVPQDWRTYNKCVAAAHSAVIRDQAQLKVLAALAPKDSS